MNFTKEYIELCKCKEIQGLRNKFHRGDWYRYPNGKTYRLIDKWQLSEYDRNRVIWLPTGDNLDEEIVKICKPKRWMYQFWYEDSFDYHALKIDARKDIDTEYVSDNPLIAKIKLLIQLKGVE